MERIKTNLRALWKRFVAWWGSLSAVITVLLSFVSWDDIGITSGFHRVLILFGFSALAALIAIVTVLVKNRKEIYGDINRGVELCYGDIIKLRFPRNRKEKRIIVIPVNRCFDLSCEDNLISQRSIHGQWINHYIKVKDQRAELDHYIQQTLAHEGAKYELLQEGMKPSGNQKRYRPGTIVELPEKDGITFYLLALSSLDKDLKACCSELQFCEALQGLLEYYDKHGDQENMYCPVMGDHILTPFRETSDIIPMMLSFFRFNKSRIRGKIYLVVYEKMKSDISILDY